MQPHGKRLTCAIVVLFFLFILHWPQRVRSNDIRMLLCCKRRRTTYIGIFELFILGWSRPAAATKTSELRSVAYCGPVSARCDQINSIKEALDFNLSLKSFSSYYYFFFLLCSSYCYAQLDAAVVEMHMHWRWCLHLELWIIKVSRIHVCGHRHRICQAAVDNCDNDIEMYYIWMNNKFSIPISFHWDMKMINQSQCGTNFSYGSLKKYLPSLLKRYESYLIGQTRNRLAPLQFNSITRSGHSVFNCGPIDDTPWHETIARATIYWSFHSSFSLQSLFRRNRWRHKFFQRFYCRTRSAEQRERERESGIWNRRRLMWQYAVN